MRPVDWEPYDYRPHRSDPGCSENSELGFVTFAAACLLVAGLWLVLQ